MSDDVADRLRALARDCFEGRSTQAAYRRLRAPLLDSLVAHETVADDAGVITKPRVVADRTLPSAAAPLRRRSRGARRAVGIAIAAVLIIGLIVGGWLAWKELAFVNGIGWTPTAQTAPEVTQIDGVHALVQPLLDSSDWSDDWIAAVNTGLLEAGRARMAADARSEWFEHFASAVRRRLKQQQALGGGSSPDKSPLAALAVTIGIDLKAPDSPIRDAAPEASGGVPAPRSAPAGSPGPTVNPGGLRR